MLKGKCALITGSLDGIGYAIAEALALQGCSVMLNGFGDDAFIEKQVGGLKASGADADYHGADISDPLQIEDMVATTQRRFGSIDIVVNNAVTRHYAFIEEVPPEKWNYALAVNLSAPFHVTRLTIAGMKKRQWGRYINIASNYGLAGTTRRADYCSTKHGLVGLTKVVALEGLPFHITANAICPGATLTPNMRKILAERQKASGESDEETLRNYMAGRQPSRRFIEPRRIGGLAAFLCSDDACDITGSPITIDGGWIANS
jgi:3-hydroxybutyrate dehydrogenase